MCVCDVIVCTALVYYQIHLNFIIKFICGGGSWSHGRLGNVGVSAWVGGWVGGNVGVLVCGWVGGNVGVGGWKCWCGWVGGCWWVGLWDLH